MKYNLHRLGEGVDSQQPMVNYPIEFTGTLEECEEYATDDDYHWVKYQRAPNNGYYFRSTDRESGRKAQILLLLKVKS